MTQPQSLNFAAVTIAVVIVIIAADVVARAGLVTRRLEEVAIRVQRVLKVDRQALKPLCHSDIISLIAWPLRVITTAQFARPRALARRRLDRVRELVRRFLEVRAQRRQMIQDVRLPPHATALTDSGHMTHAAEETAVIAARMIVRLALPPRPLRRH